MFDSIIVMESHISKIYKSVGIRKMEAQIGASEGDYSRLTSSGRCNQWNVLRLLLLSWKTRGVLQRKCSRLRSAPSHHCTWESWEGKWVEWSDSLIFTWSLGSLTVERSLRNERDNSKRERGRERRLMAGREHLVLMSLSIPSDNRLYRGRKRCPSPYTICSILLQFAHYLKGIVASMRKYCKYCEKIARWENHLWN